MNINDIGKHIVEIISGIINFILLVIILFFVAIASYALWDSNQIHMKANAKQYENYKPSENEFLSFGDLQAINSDVIAWLTVYGTQIDYPVVQGPDNIKYVNTNVYGEHSLSGNIFLDSRNNPSFSDFNNILYGHHMEKQVMFGELHKFSDEDFFKTHRYGNFFYDKNDHGLEFIAFIYTDAYDKVIFDPNISGLEAQETYLQALLEKAVQKRDIKINNNDRILLLSTCSALRTNGRDILIAKIVENIYEDSFIDETDKSITGIDRVQSIWNKTPLWLKSFVAFLIILLSLWFYHKRSHTKERS